MTYYLIKNENGFENIVKEGEICIVKKEMKKLEKQSSISTKIKYYIIQKEDWCPECPLIPVDLS